MFLLTGGVGLDNLIPIPSDWIPIRCWDEIVRYARCTVRLTFKNYRMPKCFSLSDYPNFKNLHTHVAQNLSHWKKYYDSDEPQNAQLPEPWNSKMSRFQTLIILRCFRSDKLVPAVQNYVDGKKSGANISIIEYIFRPVRKCVVLLISSYNYNMKVVRFCGTNVA